MNDVEPPQISGDASPWKHRNKLDLAMLQDEELFEVIAVLNNLKRSEMLSAELKFFVTGDLGHHRYMRPASGGHANARQFADGLHEALKKLEYVRARIEQLSKGPGDESRFFAWQLVNAAASSGLVLTPTPLDWVSRRLRVNEELLEVAKSWANFAKEPSGRNVPQRDLHEVALIGLVAALTIAHGGTLGRMHVDGNPTEFQQTCYEMMRRRKHNLGKEYLPQTDFDREEAARHFHRNVARLFNGDSALVERINRVAEFERQQPKHVAHVGANLNVWMELLAGTMPFLPTPISE